MMQSKLLVMCDNDTLIGSDRWENKKNSKFKILDSGSLAQDNLIKFNITKVHSVEEHR